MTLNLPKKQFNIKKDVNLLRGFTEDGGSTAGN